MNQKNTNNANAHDALPPHADVGIKINIAIAIAIAIATPIPVGISTPIPVPIVPPPPRPPVPRRRRPPPRPPRLRRLPGRPLRRQVHRHRLPRLHRCRPPRLRRPVALRPRHVPLHPPPRVAAAPHRRLPPPRQARLRPRRPPRRLARPARPAPPGFPPPRAGAFAALWLWNPMVAAISARGSCEGLLGVLTAALVWAVEARRVGLAGAVLGLAVHFKIYPFIWAGAVVWWMDRERMGGPRAGPAAAPEEPASLGALVRGFVSPDRMKLAAVSLATFMGLNALMYSVYGTPFLTHTFLHHVSRIDHRHNFSPYNTLLYLTSAEPASSLRAESLAFLPQLLLSCVLIPFVLAKKDLATSMMAQTLAFVTFNKVCTSQYFLWYMIFLPLYLPGSTLLRKPAVGVSALVLWIAAQAAWLQQGYQLEFLGRSTFFPGLWAASLAFFLVNCWILGIIICDGAVTHDKLHVE
ncbi:uncharacterized protein UV8b_01686 [Ustilaginoidea virens]|uniref:GPI mannosyltransferase 1 n=1 Tax=Ustilaginoidea virens TaxID=1159556 RepID=A0A8E5HLG8_USTVR|nr:uncharacterized protein UV8b_01686 [Ustilaginoidea virens]QUC17445.1 hypothetical protein UV8b_01686 [Ustilaginoidea virens]